MMDTTDRAALIKIGIIQPEGPWNPKGPLNAFQQEALNNKRDLREPLPQSNGLPLPPLVVQWREEYARKSKTNKRVS